MASNMPVDVVPPIPTASKTVPVNSVPLNSVSPTTVAPTTLSLTVMPPSSTVSPNEQSWTIKVKNADGTTSEMTLEPKSPEHPMDPVNPVVDKLSDDLEKKVDVKKSQPAPLSGKVRFYLIVQYCLNSILAITIIAIMILTYVKYNASKNIPGAWPTDPVTAPTALMMVVSIVNLTVDAFNLLAQCCGARVIKAMNRFVANVRKTTGLLMAIGPAIAAGFCKFGLDASKGNDLWGWSCSAEANKMQSVNAASLICSSTTAAFDLQILQVAFQLLSVLVPLFSQYRAKQVNGTNAQANINGGDEEAADLIKESTTIIEVLTKT